MATVEKIYQAVQHLPEQLQSEVLDFVEYLLTKAEHDVAKQERQDWSNVSLSLAMRGMEDEQEPKYSVSDLKESFL